MTFLAFSILMHLSDDPSCAQRDAAGPLNISYNNNTIVIEAGSTPNSGNLLNSKLPKANNQGPLKLLTDVETSHAEALDAQRGVR